MICALYRQPNSSKHLNKNFLQFFEGFLSKLTREAKKEVFIIGKVIVNYFDKSNGKPFKEILSLNIQTVKRRITDTTETLIGVILTTKPENMTDVKVITS